MDNPEGIVSSDPKASGVFKRIRDQSYKRGRSDWIWSGYGAGEDRETRKLKESDNFMG